MLTYSTDTPLVFLDLETTGTNFARDRIMEIGLVEVDNNGIREWKALIDPGVPIKPFTTGLTGIDDDMVRGALTFAQIAESLRERLRDRIFIAHSARFDYGFLKGEFARVGIDFRATVLCTVKLSRKLYPKEARHNLDSLIVRHQIQVNARHRALADAQVLWQLWQAWRKALGDEVMAAAIRTMIRPTTLPDTLDPALADDLPESPGAYVLRDEAGKILEIHRGPNLRSKVLSHFSDGRGNRPTGNLVRSVDWTGAAGEFGARLAEIAYQRRVQPVAPELCAWRLEEVGPGDFRPRLVMTSDGFCITGENANRLISADFGRDEHLYGLFSTMKEARQTLRKMAEGHFLCPILLGLDTVKGKPGETPCTAIRSGHCRGACVGKEPISRHSTRLMTALARLNVKVWPYAGPVALVERDEFGMLEDFHLFDMWRYLGRVHDEAELHSLLGSGSKTCFDPDIYKCFLKYTQGSRLRLITLPKQD